ncbi:Hint domain-containing protein [Poseidonocella pacifica]|uniref:Hint domain-containing protein n=1 Tax=Poseidonocella pacifica TaxID=871651 RepID=A0A1I0YQE5_9RHOB|nr:Hint domain-containing protein [Poseidonocella pacifica]SFB14680.1 Hint domain-containing protein [Poseidonocella pacifica]
MPTIAVYDWSVVSHDGAMTTSELVNDTDANDPGAANYDAGRSSWVGVNYTYDGNPPTQMIISDDDAFFQDGTGDTAGDQFLLEDVVVNGKLYPAGTVVQNEFGLHQNINGNMVNVYVLRLGNDNVGLIPAAGLPTPHSGARFSPTSSSDSDLANSSTGSTNETSYDDVICFEAKAMIATPNGGVEAQDLRPGDMIDTLDRGAQPLLWTGHQKITFSSSDDKRRPIRIDVDAFGPGLPARALLLSPQHRILLTGRPGEPDELGPALGFLDLPGVSRVRGRASVTYVHLLLPRHEIIRAEGLASESFFPGPTAMRMLPPSQRSAVRAQWHELPPTGADHTHAVRPLLTRRQTRDRLMRYAVDA